MALRSRQKYDPNKIDKLAEHVRLYSERGEPVDYEIVVDGFKAVRRTNNPDMFSLYESFLGSDSAVMEINFYHNNSNTYDKHVFLLKDEPAESLQGIDLDKRIQEQVQRERNVWEHALLREENQKLKNEIADLEKEIDGLEKEKQELFESRSPLEGFLGEFGSSFVESFVRRNPKILASLPGGETLAGILEKDDVEREQPGTVETEVTFTPKTESASAQLTRDDQSAVEFVNHLKAQFTRDEFDKLTLIINLLSQDKEGIDEVIHYLQSDDKTHEQV